MKMKFLFGAASIAAIWNCVGADDNWNSYIKDRFSAVGSNCIKDNNGKTLTLQDGTTSLKESFENAYALTQMGITAALNGKSLEEIGGQTEIEDGGQQLGWLVFNTAYNVAKGKKEIEFEACLKDVKFDKKAGHFNEDAKIYFKNFGLLEYINSYMDNKKNLQKDRPVDFNVWDNNDKTVIEGKANNRSEELKKEYDNFKKKFVTTTSAGGGAGSFPPPPPPKQTGGMPKQRQTDGGASWLDGIKSFQFKNKPDNSSPKPTDEKQSEQKVKADGSLSATWVKNGEAYDIALPDNDEIPNREVINKVIYALFNEKNSGYNMQLINKKNNLLALRITIDDKPIDITLPYYTITFNEAGELVLSFKHKIKQVESIKRIIFNTFELSKYFKIENVQKNTDTSKTSSNSNTKSGKTVVLDTAQGLFKNETIGVNEDWQDKGLIKGHIHLGKWSTGNGITLDLYVPADKVKLNQTFIEDITKKIKEDLKKVNDKIANQKTIDLTIILPISYKNKSFFLNSTGGFATIHKTILEYFLKSINSKIYIKNISDSNDRQKAYSAIEAAVKHAQQPKEAIKPFQQSKQTIDWQRLTFSSYFKDNLQKIQEIDTSTGGMDEKLKTFLEKHKQEIISLNERMYKKEEISLEDIKTPIESFWNAFTQGSKENIVDSCKKYIEHAESEEIKKAQEDLENEKKELNSRQRKFETYNNKWDYFMTYNEQNNIIINQKAAHQNLLYIKNPEENEIKSFKKSETPKIDTTTDSDDGLDFDAMKKAREQMMKKAQGQNL